MHEPQPFTAPAVPLAQAPALYQPHALQQLPPHDVVLDEAADPRRALVQLEDGRWVVARVPPAPPVIVPAAPKRRRPAVRCRRWSAARSSSSAASAR